MRLIQVVSTLEVEASGSTYVVPRISQALAARGHRVELMSVRGAELRLAGVSHTIHRKDHERTPLLRSLWLSEDLRRTLLRQAAGADVIHSHGLWLMPNIYPAWAGARRRRPLVVSTHGALSPTALAISARAKRLFWAALQGGALRRAALLHATSEQEYQDIRAAGLRAPVAVIPHGVDMPAPPLAEPAPGRRRLLYLGRFHAIKGLENLIRAWAAVAPGFPEWELRMVGYDDGDEGRLRSLAESLAAPRLTFASPRYGADKTKEYLAAELYVLPSLSENFGVTVAEALAHARPVITTDRTPWAEVVARGCGWSTSADEAGLREALATALSREPAALARMGAAGRAWVTGTFGWERIGAQMEAAYAWILQGGTPPQTVHLQ